MTQQPIDTATVQRCIEALKGTGEYDRQWKRQPYQRDAELIETWTYHQHPMDILTGLLVPEKTEAEKLVDEWFEDGEDWFDSETQRLGAFAQFILDKQRSDNPAEVLREIATDFAEEHGYAVDHQSFDDAAAHLKELISPSDMPVVEKSNPTYVFGRWIAAVDGQTPNFPHGWSYQMRSARTGKINPNIIQFSGRYNSIYTEYRPVFGLGKWYDWTGGPCPVEPGVKVYVKTRDGYVDDGGYTAGQFACADSGTANWWTYEDCPPEDQIVSFKIVGDAV